MNKRIFLTLTLALVASAATAQQSSFGFKIASTLYRPQTEFSNVGRPRPGVEAGVSSRFDLGQTNAHRLMVEFGYLMGNSPAPTDPNLYYIEGRTLAQQNGEVVDANALYHCLNLGLMYQFNPLKNDRYNFYIGPEANWLFGITTVVDYLAGGSTEPLQDISTISRRDIEQNPPPAYYFNLRYGADISFARGQSTDWKIYLNLVNQLDVRPYLPAGLLIGVKAYFGMEGLRND
jgi:hypothetical protein